MPPTTFQLEDIIQVIAGGQFPRWVQVRELQQLDVIDDGFSEVSAGTRNKETDIADLNPPQGELLELDGIGVRGGWGPNNRVEVEVFVPSNTQLLGTSTAPRAGSLHTENSPWASPKPFSLYVTYQREPAFAFDNKSNRAITPELRYVGARYAIEALDDHEVEEIKELGIPYDTIYIGGLRA